MSLCGVQNGSKVRFHVEEYRERRKSLSTSKAARNIIGWRMGFRVCPMSLADGWALIPDDPLFFLRQHARVTAVVILLVGVKVGNVRIADERPSFQQLGMFGLYASSRQIEILHVQPLSRGCLTFRAKQIGPSIQFRSFPLPSAVGVLRSEFFSSVSRR